jgi:hypothetical protein
MADTDAKATFYPYISANVWTELRLRFQKSVPAKVTASYLQSALGFGTEKAAQNLLPQLRRVGLIDTEGVPTDLARKYRIDDSYEDAVEEILASVYPNELRDLFPGPDENQSDVTAWFMRDTGGGQASANTQARFYLSIASGVIPAAVVPRKSANSDTSPKPRKSVGTSRSALPQATKTAEAPVNAARGNRTPSAQQVPMSNPRPNLHVDVQVHISADASSDQIDAVFASMAKHLYGTD